MMMFDVHTKQQAREIAELNKQLTKDEVELHREVKTLRQELAEKDAAEAALRRELKARDKKVEAAEKALREKEQELEGAYRTFRNMVGISETPQRSSDAQTPSRDNVPTSKERVFAPYPGGQYPTSMVPGSPRTRREQYQEEEEKIRITGHQGGD
jgi:seryl-tRNA synthetase